MSNTKQILWTFVLGLAVLGTATAQNNTNSTAQRLSSTITAAASGERVRITAPSSIVQMHVEVYAVIGEKLFDNEIRGGNVFDWHLQNGQAERLSVGDYVCVVTVKNIVGRITQKIGAVRVGEKEVRVGPAETVQLSPQQSQAIGPVEDNSSWTILDGKENQTTTVIAHDGADGQIVRGRGALSFRIGDFFSGRDKEQMRLTEAGNLGIGTAKPKFKLDVAGAVRARQGFVFADGSTLNVNDKGALTLTNSNGTAVPNVSGTGTTGLLTKWTDGANGTLGDSVVTELNGNIGVSNPNPTAKLVVDASSSSELRFDQGIGGVTPVLSVISQPGSTTQGGASILGAGTGGSSFVFSDNLPFFLVKDTKANVINNNLGHGTVLFTLLPTGNVGIGTAAPNAVLNVVGSPPPSTNNVPGLEATPVLQILGAKGGFATGANGGAGAQLRLQSGDGGDGSPGIGGNGGNVTLQSGNGGFGQGGAGGIGGNVTLQAGSGGGESGLRAGDGGGVVIQAGNGADSGHTAGNGGPITLQPGVGGASLSPFGTAGVSGNILLVPSNGNVGIGTDAPGSRLHVNVPSSASPISAASIDVQSFSNPSNALASHFFRVRDIGSGAPSAFFIRGDGNVGIGTEVPNARLHIAVNGGNILAGNAGCNSGFNGIGFGSSLSGCTNYSLLGNGTDTIINRPTGGAISFRENNGEQMSIEAGGNVQFGGNGSFRIDAPGVFGGRLYVGADGLVEINSPNFTTHPDLKLSVNGVIATNLATAGLQGICYSIQGYLAQCGSSIRYKENINNFSPGFNLIRRLRPVSFNWKQGGMADLGLIAEDVAKVEPLLVTHNNKGEVEGVKYDRVAVVLINAVKEQQAQIEAQRKRIEDQQKQVDDLKKIVCELKPAAQLCKVD